MWLIQPLRGPEALLLGNIWSTVWCHDYWFITFLYPLKRIAEKPPRWENPN